MSDVPRRTRQQLDERADGWCEACEAPLIPNSMTEGPAVHHRLLRSAGGDHRLSNLMLVHHSCHNVAPGSIHQNDARSRRLYHILDSGTDPDTAPRPTVVRGLRLVRD